MNKAVEVASKHPGAHWVTASEEEIEVRPIDMLDQPVLRVCDS